MERGGRILAVRVNFYEYSLYGSGSGIYGTERAWLSGGRLILEAIEEKYQKLPIREFMRSGYALCLEHEEEIRTHMERAERRGLNKQEE